MVWNTDLSHLRMDADMSMIVCVSDMQCQEKKNDEQHGACTSMYHHSHSIPSVGAADGSTVGVSVGNNVGVTVGAAVGVVGASVGVTVGVAVGDCVGVTVVTARSVYDTGNQC